MYLLWRGKEQVAATYDFRNAHKGIVHDYCQLVCPGTIFTTDNIVAAMFGKVDVVPAIVIVGEEDSTIGNDEASSGGGNVER